MAANIAFSYPSLCNGLSNRQLEFAGLGAGYCCRRGSIVCSSSSAASSQTVKTITNGWRSFSKRVSGEWSGCGVDFDHTGKPVQLPPSLVPQEYSEWGVDVFDWETYCATLAKEDTLKFYNKTLRLYPTVGCSATTVSIYKTEEQALQAESQEASLAFHPSGAYVANWKHRKVVEHCLVNDENDEKSRIRIRVLQQLNASSLQLITVYKEQWEDRFQSGNTVESCLTRHAGLSSGRRLCADDVGGSWQTVKSISMMPDEGCESINELATDSSTTLTEMQNLDGFVLLPEGIWSCVRIIGDELHVGAGWLISSTNAAASVCKLSTSGTTQKFEFERLARIDKNC